MTAFLKKKKRKHGDFVHRSIPNSASSYGISLNFKSHAPEPNVIDALLYPSNCLIQDLARSNDKKTPPNNPV